MRLVDWLTLLVIVVGPIFAVMVQLGFERRREKRRRKLSVLDTLMSYRGRFVQSDNVRALNTIEIIFYDNSAVRERFSKLLGHLDSDPMKAIEPSQEAISIAEDLIAELISEIAKDVGYSFDHTVIKRQAYHPKAFNDEDKYTREVRGALIPILKGTTALHVKVEAERTDGPN